MGRRTVLLIVAALVALLGTSLVFLYARGADNRALADQDPVQVLKAVTQIDTGETLTQAQAEGKLQLAEVPRQQVLAGAVNSLSGLGDKVALATIYPQEQIVSSKFGAAGDQDTLSMPKGNVAISVTMSDTGRVAGFVAPGSDVAVFSSGSNGGQDAVRLLLPKVQIIAAGTTTTKQDPSADANATAAATQSATLYTLSVDQDQAERVIYASSHGTLTFALLNSKSKVVTGPGVTSKNLYR